MPQNNLGNAHYFLSHAHEVTRVKYYVYMEYYCASTPPVQRKPIHGVKLQIKVCTTELRDAVNNINNNNPKYNPPRSTA